MNVNARLNDTWTRSIDTVNGGLLITAGCNL
jgi:hypothetical protein